MHVMIATDGHVKPHQGAMFAASLGAGGKVTVLTVVEVPRSMFEAMREAGTLANTSSNPSQSAHSREGVAQGQGASSTHWMGDDAAIAQYINARSLDATGPLCAELDALDVAYEVVALESEEAAATILEEADAREVDVLFIGTRKLRRFDGLLGSISTKIARNATCSVLLIR